MKIGQTILIAVVAFFSASLGASFQPAYTKQSLELSKWRNLGNRIYQTVPSPSVNPSNITPEQVWRSINPCTPVSYFGGVEQMRGCNQGEPIAPFNLRGRFVYFEDNILEVPKEI